MTDRRLQAAGEGVSADRDDSTQSSQADPSSQSDEAPIQYVEWNDVKAGVRQLVRVWAGDGDVAWVKEAWHRLATRGWTEYDGTGLGRTRLLVRILALGHLYWDFTYTAFDLGTDIGFELGNAQSDLDISPFYIGQLLGPDAYAEDGYERPDLASACWQLSCGERPKVVRALLEAFQGEDLLFVSLWRSSLESDGADAEPDEEEVLSQDVCVEKMKGYDWVVDGCPVLHACL